MGHPNVFPTGTTIYNPEKTYSGYTIMSVPGQGAVLIDMNGNVVKNWVDFQGFPNKLMPNGNVMGSLGCRDAQYGYQDMTDVTQVDWDGNIVWSFNKKELCKDGDQEYWLARQHHDYQREGNPVGYYVPGMDCRLDGGKTLILGHEDLYNHRISDKRLLDDCIFEVDWEGNILWQWNAHKHFNEMHFSEQEKNVLFRNPNTHQNGGGQSDWVHINSASYLGPNKWYEAGDERFHPDNIIWDSREANIIAIISRETGKIVWQIGPDFTVSKELRIMGQIIGLHHAHMIPQGLPGEGNILLFDNGGWAGYGYPSRTSKDGTKADIREYSRVLEFNPVTLEVVWEFTGAAWPGMAPFVDKSKFFSPLISSAQRLPNGNTLVTEGCFLRLFEVTPEKEVVWEYIAPFEFSDAYIYRAYRYPYEYVPQLPKPNEIPVGKLNNNTFRVPGAAEGLIANQTTVAGTWGYTGRMDACVTEDKLE